jgi:hypothetical protein
MAPNIYSVQDIALMTMTLDEETSTDADNALIVVNDAYTAYILSNLGLMTATYAYLTTDDPTIEFWTLMTSLGVTPIVFTTTDGTTLATTLSNTTAINDYLLLTNWTTSELDSDAAYYVVFNDSGYMGNMTTMTAAVIWKQASFSDTAATTTMTTAKMTQATTTTS